MTNKMVHFIHTTSVSDPDPDWIRIQSGQWIRIQEGKNNPQKVEKNSCFEVLDVLLLGAEALFYSLEILYRGLGMGKL